jgi:hypothetical protein
MRIDRPGLRIVVAAGLSNAPAATMSSLPDGRSFMAMSTARRSNIRWKLAGSNGNCNLSFQMQGARR